MSVRNLAKIVRESGVVRKIYEAQNFRKTAVVESYVDLDDRDDVWRVTRVTEMSEHLSARYRRKIVRRTGFQNVDRVIFEFEAKMDAIKFAIQARKIGLVV